MIKNRIPSLLVGKQLKVRIGLVTIMKISTKGRYALRLMLDIALNDCPRQTDCVTLELWKRMDQAIKDVVDNVTLADLIEWKQQKGNNYCI